MPMAPYRHIDFNSRISAIRNVGLALGTTAINLPGQSASNSDLHCWRWINILFGLNGLSNPHSLDYGSFTSAINQLVAKVP